MSKENLLPQKVDAFRLAEQAISLQGMLHVNALPRFSANLADKSGEVSANVQFGVDEQGVHFMCGEYIAHLRLPCQRCLEPFGYDITGHFLFGLLHSEEKPTSQPDNMDMVFTEEGILELQNVIEDELIIGMPIVPKHHPEDCKVKLPLVFDSNDKTQEIENENPFKVIELLRDKRNSDSK